MSDKKVKTIWSHFWVACRNVGFVLLISTLSPIVLMWLVGMVTKQPEFYGVSGFLEATISFFVPQEILVYVTTLLAAPLTFVYFEWKASNHANFYLIMLTSCGITLFLSALIYAFGKTNVEINLNIVSTIAYICYGVALLLWLFIAWYEQYFTHRSPTHVESGSNINF